jgi:hypothetical protein
MPYTISKFDVRDLLEEARAFRRPGVTDGIMKWNDVVHGSPGDFPFRHVFEDPRVSRVAPPSWDLAAFDSEVAHRLFHTSQALFGTDEHGVPGVFSLASHGMVLAGGAVSAAITRRPADADAYMSDFDLFLVGHTDSSAKAAVVALVNTMAATLHCLCTVYHTYTTVTVVADTDTPIVVQVILRNYSTVAEILHGFDMGACAAAYTGTDVWVSALGRLAFESGVNVLCLDGRRHTYEFRLAKYWRRGFDILLPDLDLAAADCEAVLSKSSSFRTSFMVFLDVTFEDRAVMCGDVQRRRITTETGPETNTTTASTYEGSTLHVWNLPGFRHTLRNFRALVENRPNDAIDIIKVHEDGSECKFPVTEPTMFDMEMAGPQDSTSMLLHFRTVYLRGLAEFGLGDGAQRLAVQAAVDTMMDGRQLPPPFVLRTVDTGTLLGNQEHPISLPDWYGKQVFAAAMYSSPGLSSFIPHAVLVTSRPPTDMLTLRVMEEMIARSRDLRRPKVSGGLVRVESLSPTYVPIQVYWPVLWQEQGPNPLPIHTPTEPEDSGEDSDADSNSDLGADPVPSVIGDTLGLQDELGGAGAGVAAAGVVHGGSWDEVGAGQNVARDITFARNIRAGPARSSAETLRQFKKNLQLASKNMLWPLSLQRLGMVLAGGSVAALVAKRDTDTLESPRFRPEVAPFDDFDLFLVGHTGERSVKQAIVALFSHLQRCCKAARAADALVHVRATTTSISFRVLGVTIQVVLRLYSTVAEVLHGFDMGSCAMAFDGSQVMTTELGKLAFDSLVNIVCLDGRRATYESRLRKYMRRGYGIVLRGMDASQLLAAVRQEGGRAHMTLGLPRVTVQVSRFGTWDGCVVLEGKVLAISKFGELPRDHDMGRYEDAEMPVMGTDTAWTHKWNFSAVLAGKEARIVNQYTLSTRDLPAADAADAALDEHPFFANVAKVSREVTEYYSKCALLQLSSAMQHMLSADQIREAKTRIQTTKTRLEEGIAIPFVLRCVDDGTLLTTVTDEHSLTLGRWFGQYADFMLAEKT